MTQAGQRSGFWRSVRDLLGRTSLRVKLITAVLTLVAIALGVISVAGIQILKDDLLGPPDAGLSGSINAATDAVGNYLNTGNQLSRQDVAVDWISGGRIHQVVVPSTGGFGPGGGGPYGFPPQSRPMSGPAVQASASWLAANNGHILTLPAQSGGGRWRVLLQSEGFSTASGHTITGTVALAVDVTGVYQTLGKLTGIDVIVSGILLFGLFVLGFALVRSSLRPLTDIEQTAAAIAAGDLSRRVPERDPRTEVGRLGRSLNVMLSQIETAFKAQSRSGRRPAGLRRRCASSSPMPATS